MVSTSGQPQPRRRDVVERELARHRHGAQQPHVGEALEHHRVLGVAAAAEALQRPVGGGQPRVAGGDLGHARLEPGGPPGVVQAGRALHEQPCALERHQRLGQRVLHGLVGADRHVEHHPLARVPGRPPEGPPTHSDRLARDDQPLGVEPVEEDPPAMPGLAEHRVLAHCHVVGNTCHCCSKDGADILTAWVVMPDRAAAARPASARHARVGGHHDHRLRRLDRRDERLLAAQPPSAGAARHRGAQVVALEPASGSVKAKQNRVLPVAMPAASGRAGPRCRGGRSCSPPSPSRSRAWRPESPPPRAAPRRCTARASRRRRGALGQRQPVSPAARRSSHWASEASWSSKRRCAYRAPIANATSPISRCSNVGSLGPAWVIDVRSAGIRTATLGAARLVFNQTIG